jgi:inner membrane protein
MLAKTHLLAGLLFSWLVVESVSIPNEWLFVLVFTFASVLPDIDSHESLLGSKIKPLSFLFEIIFGHRGFLHSIWVPLGLFALLWYLGFFAIGLAALMGYVLHLIMDSMTMGGVKFFGIKKFSGFLKTGDLVESFLFFVLVLVLIWKIIKFII